MGQIQMKSLYKAMKVLETFSVEEPELSVTEISKRLNLYKSNVFNILSTFEELGYVSKNPENSKYRLSFKVLNLSYVINAHMSIQRLMLPYMQKIADVTKENVYLAVPDNSEVVYLESCSPYGIVPTRSLQGERAPMYCTAIGKAMLAFLPESVKMSLEKGLKSFTDNTITKEKDLIDELERIRQQGFAIDNMEHEYGIKCIAIPLRGKNGDVVAAMSISGPSLRMGDEVLAHYERQLKKLKEEIEERYQF